MCARVSSEEQAIARAWRYGQTREVFVYRLLARNTVEMKLVGLQVGPALPPLLPGCFSLLLTAAETHDIGQVSPLLASQQLCRLQDVKREMISAVLPEGGLAAELARGGESWGTLAALFS